MRIAEVKSDISFGSKYLPNNLCQNIKNLKLRMECDTVIIKGKDINQTINTRGLSINNGEAVFKDGKFLAKRNKKKELVPYGADTAMIEFGKIRIISDSNGEVLEHKKPFYKSWEYVFEQADKYVRCALDNYNNENIVKKICNKKESLTASGKKQAQKLMELFDSLNPYSDKK